VNSERDLATEGSVKKASYAPLESSVASLLRNDKRLVKSPHPLFPSWTQIIDLTKSEEELLKSMHHKTRYNIRLAQKKGVVVKEIANDEAFEIFSKLYFETCKRQKYFGHSLSYHKTVWENLKKEIAYILIAFYKDTPLAAYELFFFHDTMYYPYGGTSLEFRNLMASNLLLWEAIRLGRKISAKKFDVWGSLSADYENGHPWAGFTRFKQGYGGKFTQLIGSFDLVINPVEYKIYNALSKLRNSFLYLKNLI
ncbi:peptidoglycan bridge formation glycyltransferase FemA/FemB family protein, partial [Candidatus Roizmanbacteria bacterium]|nr:peptidoglycan bridge formation glycyltransferase FemA/FemB family protein [Candidatus Roizmanbacteria bacterium]